MERINVSYICWNPFYLLNEHLMDKVRFHIIVEEVNRKWPSEVTLSQFYYHYKFIYTPADQQFFFWAFIDNRRFKQCNGYFNAMKW